MGRSLGERGRLLQPRVSGQERVIEGSSSILLPGSATLAGVISLGRAGWGALPSQWEYRPTPPPHPHPPGPCRHQGSVHLFIFLKMKIMIIIIIKTLEEIYFFSLFFFFLF